MKVSSTVQELFRKNSMHKNLIVEFPEIGLKIAHSQIHADSLELKESISDSVDFEFVGCIASQMKIDINGITQDVEGKKISVSISVDGAENEPIPLFNGYVDSAKNKSNSWKSEIVAYDALYGLADMDVSEWIKNLQTEVVASGKKITVKRFRNLLFDYLEIKQKKTKLINDGMKIEKLIDLDADDGEQIMALSLIKAVCQINAVFGIMNRYEQFEYRKIGVEQVDDGAYPGVDADGGLYPPFIPGDMPIYAVKNAAFFPYYKDVQFQRFTVGHLSHVYVRQEDKSRSGYAGSGGRKYFVQGNRFTIGTSKTQKQNIATAILSEINAVAYTPFTAVNVGLPYIEVGDPVSYYVRDFEETKKQGKDVYVLKSFFILSRTLKGIQALMDTYTAIGEEGKKRYVSDLGVRESVSNEELQEKIDQNTADIAVNTLSIASNTQEITGIKNSSYNFAGVRREPTPAERQPRTIYFIQGSAG